MFLRSGAHAPDPNFNFNSRIQIQIRLSLSPPHAPHQNPKKPVRVPFFVFVFGLCLPVASARAGQCCRRSPTHLPCVPVTCPRLARFPISSRPAPIPSPDPQSPSPEPLSSPHPISPPSPTLHSSARSRTRASDAESLIQSTLCTETTTVTDGTSIQDAALWSGQVGSCRVNLGHPLSISAAQFRARVSALLYSVLSCSALLCSLEPEVSVLIWHSRFLDSVGLPSYPFEIAWRLDSRTHGLRTTDFGLWPHNSHNPHPHLQSTSLLRQKCQSDNICIDYRVLNSHHFAALH